MSPETTSNCPACKKANAADMAFCIYCGSGMKGQNAPATSADWLSAGSASSGSSTNKCAACGRADALNGQFCIFCGAPLPELGGAARSGQKHRTEHVAASKSSWAGGGYKNAPNHFGLWAAAISLGLIVGSGAALAYKLNQPLPGSVALPPRGLAVLTAQPYADVYVTYPDKRHFLVGRAGSGGDLSVDDLLPGTYVVAASGTQGQAQTVDVVVGQNKAGVAGGPPGPQLLSAAGAGNQ